MDIEKIGTFIKTRRINSDMTQKELAEKLGCTDKAVSRWETGKGLPEASFLIPLSNILDVTVNELLTGEKISEETLPQKSDDNLVNAVKRTEKAVKKGRTAILFLIAALVVCVLSVSLLIKKSIDEQNTATFAGTFNTKNSTAVAALLEELNHNNQFFTENTVCTDYEIELDTDGKIIKADFTMNDEFRHEYINVILFSLSEQPEELEYRILRQRNYISSEDGILFKDLCDFLTEADITGECKKHSDIDDFDAIFIVGQSTLYFNFDNENHISFDRQHLFDGELKKVDDARSLDGKYYEIVISVINKTTSENGGCFSVYVQR